MSFRPDTSDTTNFLSADAAVQTHGGVGVGVATEYDVERYLRGARLARLVPISQALALNFVGETPSTSRGRTERGHGR